MKTWDQISIWEVFGVDLKVISCSRGGCWFEWPDKYSTSSVIQGFFQRVALVLELAKGIFWWRKFLALKPGVSEALSSVSFAETCFHNLTTNSNLNFTDSVCVCGDAMEERTPHLSECSRIQASHISQNVWDVVKSQAAVIWCLSWVTILKQL